MSGGLEKAALHVANNQQAGAGRGRTATLLSRLPALGERLQQIYQHFVEAAGQELTTLYAAEWILDNNYVIEQAFRQIMQDLPARYETELPKLVLPESAAGQPRIYALARSFLEHEDQQFATDRLTRYINAYQTQQTLTMGELWALPIMLRIVLLENLLQVTATLTELWTPTALAASLPGFRPYTTEQNPNEVVAHIIPSLRLIDSEEWADFFERVSQVHRILSQDPVRLYGQMDFETRNQYRSVIESLAKGSGQREVTIAQAAIDQARAAAGVSSPGKSGLEEPFAALDQPVTYHVGYYLLGPGRQLLEQQFHFRLRGQAWFQRWLKQRPTSVYLGTIWTLAGAILLAVLAYALAQGANLWMLLLVTLVMIVPSLTIAVDFANYWVTQILSPQTLPKLDFEAGIPSHCRTLVVIPALIAQPGDIRNLFGELEQHYLRNPDPNQQLGFALLSDFADADEQTRPEDAELLAVAEQELSALNEKYAAQPFYFFHRQRLWNPLQNTWMGWERKRGKLHEFNRLLRGATDTSYVVHLGELARLPAVRYVITLDADTILPRDAAHRLIGTLAHPLNRAEFDPQTSKVTAGYTILQPRTAIKPTSANRSLFTRVFGGDVGIDLYTLAVSDVYQDLFGAGIYVGKGIYEVDTFERSLQERVPENTLLSHDLFEGIQGRAGLVTDIVLYEEYPPHYLANVLRSHRWVRGDWQLLPWLAQHVPGVTGPRRNDFSLIDRWKLADNLRRSLLPLVLLIMFVAGWTFLPGAPLFWTLLGLITPGFLPLLSALHGFGRGLFSAKRQSIWQNTGETLKRQAVRWLLFLAFLPYEALLFSDAIATSLVRLYLRRRKLLEWTTAARTVRLFGDEVSAATTMLHMLPAHLLTIAIGLVTVWVAPLSLWIALPLLLMWLLAWQIAFRISRPQEVIQYPLTGEQRTELRRLARHTWLFYEHFVGPTDNWLPPDHYQETPREGVAHRTSPTNVGMYLLSLLGAYDLGYLSTLELSVRLQSTFATLRQLDRYRGHFLNWIDTSTLEPLAPRYVSTVDSGNLAGALIALKQGCLAQSQAPIWQWRRWEGLLDTLALLEHAFTDGATNAAVTTQLRTQLAEMRRAILAVRTQPEKWYPLLATLGPQSHTVLDQTLLEALETTDTPPATEFVENCRLYSERIAHHFADLQREVDRLQPWLRWFETTPAELQTAAPDTPLGAAWQSLQAALPASPTLGKIASCCHTAQASLHQVEAALGDEATTARKWCADFAQALATAAHGANQLMAEFTQLAATAEQLVADMEFGFLFNPTREVFHIGYNLDAGQLDSNYYDLLASEARIASLIAIAKYDVPPSHWLHLGRPLTKTETGAQVLLSWSGTMFEYLMPPLLQRTYTDTLLDVSYGAAVDHQIAYGKERGVPWGISESGFYGFDAGLSYQYYAFGVPGLGFKRGLHEDLVISPYASLLAVTIRPQAVFENLRTLQSLGMWGRYGLYEAIDFTKSRLQLGQDHALVRKYMAHHQGMILVALVNELYDEIMVERFHTEAKIESVDLLLQEQVPQDVPPQYPHETEAAERQALPHVVSADAWRVTINTPLPLVHYLANGRYGLLLTNAGSGYSSWHETSLTRWRADTTLDNWGSWLYLEDLGRDLRWSAGLQPTGCWPEQHEVLYSPHMVEFRRRDHDISLHMAITVAPDADVEVRQVTLTNDSDQPRHLRLTSYSEVVLGPAAGDLRHPAFGKLFIESEYLPELNALIFRRRPRSASEAPAFLAHVLVAQAGQPLTQAYESDRAKFLGRGGTAQAPAALDKSGGWLTGTVGATLDPIMALGQEVALAPHSTAQFALLTIAAESHTALLEQIRRYQVMGAITRTFTRARAMAEDEMRSLSLTSAQIERIQYLLSLLIYPHGALRAEAAILAANRRGQSGLWAFGISGDYPILLLRLQSEEQGELLQELLRAHHYWRRRGLKIDLVILNRQETHYGQAMQGYIHRMIERLESNAWLNQRGGIFILREDQIGEPERILLQTVARVILDGANGPLAHQLSRQISQPTALPLLAPTLPEEAPPETTPPIARPTDLLFDNGLGGFSPDGHEYLLYLTPGQTTPAPWINVLANEEFGCLVSESGGGYTWAINSGENRLTSWRNDPVSDLPAEALYLRDEENVDIWSPTPQPAPSDAPYLVRHGAGYSRFEHQSHGLRQDLQIFVAPDAPVKLIRLRLENLTGQSRRLTATYYAEWVLGVERDSTQFAIVPEYEDTAHALLAHNHYSFDFPKRVSFLAANKQPHGLTADRGEFLGRFGSLRHPLGLARVGLSNRVRAGLDPCAALQLHIDLAPGMSEEITFILGQGQDRAEAVALAQRFQDPAEVSAAWQAVHEQWDRILGTVQVETPEPALNLLLNRWLLYQALACRIWGRSALYQSSGAYGFRDQLQDVMGLIHARPDLARAQILRAARHQFKEGDVLHWWHPPVGRGVRTRITDDLLWLPYVTAYYVRATGDAAILHEQIPFLQGEPLQAKEEERYGHFETTEHTASLLEHCQRALQKGSTSGPHGIPLMGGGDWNDGMNRVGIHGRGESIWLGWFLAATLHAFADLCETIGESAPVADYRQRAEQIRKAIEYDGWDGAWYRRAYYDDGTPLGSAANQECRIDAIAQSWAVLSGLGDGQRARQAMNSVMERLVKTEDQLLLLFTPPLDKTPRDPGYIKGYLPGVRENGGQYTHAALWTIWAMAELGEGDRVEELFRLINPIYRADSPEKVARYKVEPYVISADVYAVPPHTGRGGWTWYTGSSGWMYRLGLEALLGLQRVGEHLQIDPCIPRAWAGFRLDYRYGKTCYTIHVQNPQRQNRGIGKITLDGQLIAGSQIPLVDDGQPHTIELTLGGDESNPPPAITPFRRD